MKFSELTQAHNSLRKQAMLGAIGAVGKGLLGAAKGAHRFAWNSAGRVAGGNKALQGLTYGTGVAGMGLAANQGLQKSRQYSRGFDPRLYQGAA